MEYLIRAVNAVAVLYVVLTVYCVLVSLRLVPYRDVDGRWHMLERRP